jgi:hypothetical protein
MIRRATPVTAAPLAAVLLLASCSSQEPPAQTAADGVVALTGARLIDGTGRVPVEQGTLVIRDGRIEAAGAAAEVQIPAAAVRVDLSGKTVMPGIVNAHGTSSTRPTPCQSVTTSSDGFRCTAPTV